MTDEFRPNRPDPQLRRCLRLEVERPAGMVSMTIEEPTAVEVGQFFDIAREVITR